MAATTVPAFDRVRVTVAPGSDLVARMPGILLVARTDDTDAGSRKLSEILDLLESCSAAATRAPGYRVSRELPRLIEHRTAGTDLAVVAATDDGLAVVLAGDGAVAVSERGWHLGGASGGASGEVLTRETDWPAARLVLGIGASALEPEPARPAARTDPPFDLRLGVVPGGAAVLHPPEPAAAPMTSATGTIRVGPGPLPPPPEATDDAPPPTPAPRRFEPILGRAASGPSRPALPVAPGDPDPEAVRSDIRVRGYRCRDGHLNDPRVLFCSSCGIRMAESTGVFVEGPRPPLGLLVFDNGASFTLDADYLLGREPDVDERVRTGQLRPLVLFDTSGVVSRRHAEIRLADWNVLLVDCGSANGTLVADRAASEWSALVPGQPVQMPPGMQVRIGERSFVFESSLAAP